MPEPSVDKAEPWRVDLSCCGRHFDTRYFTDWQAAHDFREAFCTGVGVDPHGYGGNGRSGHQRAGIITDTRAIRSAQTYRPCAGCDSVGESCREVGCPASPRFRSANNTPDADA